jgi:hypothetical protein
MAATANGHLEAKLVREMNGVNHVSHPATSRDQRRPFVEPLCSFLASSYPASAGLSSSPENVLASSAAWQRMVGTT